MPPRIKKSWAYLLSHWKRFLLLTLPVLLWDIIEKALEHRVLGWLNDIAERHARYGMTTVVYLIAHPSLILALCVCGVVLHAYHVAGIEDQQRESSPASQPPEIAANHDTPRDSSPSYESVDAVPEDILCLFLLIKALEYSLELGNVNNVFDEKLHFLRLARRLVEKAKALLPNAEFSIYAKANDSVPYPVSWIDLAELANKFGGYFSEADFALAEPSSAPGRLTSPPFKEAFDEIYKQRKPLFDLVKITGVYRRAIAELESSTLKWPLLGFVSGADFEEWLAPTMKSLFESTEPMQIELLRRIVESGRGSEDKLKNEGFTPLEINNAFNRLLREKWAKVDVSGNLKLTKVGRRLLSAKLDSRRTSPSSRQNPSGGRH